MNARLKPRPERAHFHRPLKADVETQSLWIFMSGSSIFATPVSQIRAMNIALKSQGSYQLRCFFLRHKSLADLKLPFLQEGCMVFDSSEKAGLPPCYSASYGDLRRGPVSSRGRHHQLLLGKLQRQETYNSCLHLRGCHLIHSLAHALDGSLKIC